MTRLATKILLLGGFAGLGVAGVAAASPADSHVPALGVRYNADMLATDSGAREVYHRITKAAAQVCPNDYSMLVNKRIVECRRHAIADAVGKIHNQRLAAVYAAATPKSG
ncbi:MAG: UrcA family protein [Pseudomonadota bacterium]|nr:UrcA family protein [Pseudomonadota bacterium]